MAVPLHRLHEDGQKRLQSLAADPVGCLPDHDLHLAHRLIVNPAAEPLSTTPVHLPGPQQTHRMLAVKAGHRCELVRNPTPITRSP
jgi:hypothetical protein